MGLFDLFSNSYEKKYAELMDKCYNPDILDDDISLLNEWERIFYVLYTYDMEIQNGGICQFFINSSRMYTSLISQYLQKVNAIEHQKLFDNLLSNIDIRIEDFTALKSSSAEVLKRVSEKYNFDEFDEQYMQLDPIESYLRNLIKEHKV